MAWGIERYGDSDYLLTQLFLVLFLIAYSAMPVATLLRRAAGQGGWEEGILLFGTPLAAAFLQYGLIGDVRATLAVSAVLAAVWYGALWIVLRRAAPARNAPPSWPLVQGTQLAISITFLTLAIPLACGAQVTAALWAIEGAAVLWQGQRQARRLPVIFGLLMQCAAAVTLSLHWHALDRTLPFANDAMLSTLLLVAAALLTARVMRPAAPPGKPQSATASVNLATTHAERHDQAAIAVLAMLWALGWWFGAGGAEILRVIGERDQPAALLVFASGTIIALELLAWRWHWPLLRYTSVLLVVALWLCGAGAVAVAHHPLAGWMGLAVPLAFITHYALLWRHETTGAVPATALRHVGGGWSLLLIASAELAWQAGTLTRGATLWSWIAWTLIMTAGIAAPLAGQRWSRWPFTSPGAGYLPWGVLLPALSLTLGLAWGNVDLDGQGSGLPYLPVASAFDLTQLAGLGALVWLARSASGRLARATRGATLVLTFLWISAMAARITHQWDGTPFTFHAMAESTLFQALLTLIWTITAIGNMILASRRLVRRQWFAGFSLLCVVGAKLLLVDASDSGTLAWTATLLGVAALVLAASYFAPLPPRAPAAADER